MPEGDEHEVRADEHRDEADREPKRAGLEGAGQRDVGDGEAERHEQERAGSSKRSSTLRQATRIRLA